MFQDNLQSGNFFSDFSGFTTEFSRTLRLVEEESKIENLEENLKLEEEGTPASRLQKACVKYNENKDLSKE